MKADSSKKVVSFRVETASGSALGRLGQMLDEQVDMVMAKARPKPEPKRRSRSTNRRAQVTVDGSLGRQTG